MLKLVLTVYSISPVGPGSDQAAFVFLLGVPSLWPRHVFNVSIEIPHTDELLVSPVSAGLVFVLQFAPANPNRSDSLHARFPVGSFSFARDTLI